jgi:hypothetical protein
MRYKYLVLLLIVPLLLAACAAASPSFTGSEEGFGAAPQAAPMEFYESEVMADVASNNVYASGSAPVQVERIVIKNAELTIAVEDPAASVKTIGAMAEEMGGFVVSANTYHTTLSSGAEVPRASITVRVPAERLTEALDRIKLETDQLVRNETITSQDVTSDYTDLQSRLRNLETAEAQLQEIMEDAFETEEVLSVYQQLTQVREQIEVTKGRIQYYEQSAALSSIQVGLLANAALQPLSVGGWQPSGIARQALQTLINVLQILVTILIYLVLLVMPVLLVVLVPPGLAIWGIMRWRARRKARQAVQD